MTIRIETILERDVSDVDLQRLLMRAYVEGGFTAPERAAEIFSPAAVRARGEVLCAWPAGWTSPAGVVVLVLPPSPARRLAGDDEAEMHLLATDPECRRMGVGRALVDAAMDRAGGGAPAHAPVDPALDARGPAALRLGRLRPRAGA
jgi:ribosomal protein S18 acetylase RimI-like enzyme